mmetsp:Transcript_3225/g.7303  ORF Transcript_3225/g.7303 Transcript_3225/m.7303 type:complete len:172 (-) Transcript_3225:213-728(-)
MELTQKFLRCSTCSQHKPQDAFSRRQRNVHRPRRSCSSCCALASRHNESEQASVQKRRRHDAEEDDEDAAQLHVPTREKMNVPEPQLPLNESNKGHQMLTRLGWVPGSGLGAQACGATVPIAQLLASQRHTRGLGNGGTDDEGTFDALAMEPRLEQATWGDLPCTWEGFST